MQNETPREMEDRHIEQLEQIREKLQTQRIHWLNHNVADDVKQKMVDLLNVQLKINTTMLKMAQTRLQHL